MKRLVAFAVPLLVVAGLFIAIQQTDALSCERSNTVRISQQGYRQYALDAAVALAQAELTDHPAQRKIDAQAVIEFQRDADRTRISLLRCSGLFPANP